MPISVKHDDPGDREDASLWVVLFNGEPEGWETGRAVVTADEAEGLIVYYRRNDQGEFEIERGPDGMSQPKEYEERGRVFLYRRMDSPPPPPRRYGGGAPLGQP